MTGVRPATLSDAASLRALRLEALQLHPDSFGADLVRELGRDESWWRERLSDPGRGAIFVAPDGEGLAGMAGIRKLEGEKLSHNGMIWGVYVAPSHRARGLASQLVAACLEWAEAKRLKLVKLAVVATNEAALRCYEGAGFRAYGIDPAVIRYEGLDYDEVLMAREIRPSSGRPNGRSSAARRRAP